MNIRRAVPTDRDLLFDIWVRSVRATHDFVSPADVEAFMPLVREHLAAEGADAWVAGDDRGTVRGFIGMNGSHIDMLFLAPEYFRRGARAALHVGGSRPLPWRAPATRYPLRFTNCAD